MDWQLLGKGFHSRILLQEAALHTWCNYTHSRSSGILACILPTLVISFRFFFTGQSRLGIGTIGCLAFEFPVFNSLVGGISMCCTELDETPTRHDDKLMNVSKPTSRFLIFVASGAEAGWWWSMAPPPDHG